RLAEFRGIETSFTPLQGNLPLAGNLPFSAFDPATFIPALQQLRWPPRRIADTPNQALQRLFVLPGSHYDEPEFSWRWAIAPAAIGPDRGRKLRHRHEYRNRARWKFVCDLNQQRRCLHGQSSIKTGEFDAATRLHARGRTFAFAPQQSMACRGLLFNG